MSVAPQRVERGGDRLGPQDHPRSPAVRRVVHASGAVRGPRRAGRGCGRGQALLLDPARDALGERAVDHRREEGQDVDLEGHATVSGAGSSAGAAGSGASAASGRLGGLSRRRRLRAVLRASRPPARRLRPVGVRRPRSSRSQVERLGVDDDLATPRREDPDERADGGQVEAAERAAVDREDLRLADPVDVAHRPELGPVRAADGTADDLVPVVGAARQVLVGHDDRLEVGAAQRVGSRRAR